MACVNKSARGAWHPRNFRTSCLAPVDFEVLCTNNWHPPALCYRTDGTCSFKALLLIIFWQLQWSKVIIFMRFLKTFYGFTPDKIWTKRTSVHCICRLLPKTDKKLSACDILSLLCTLWAYFTAFVSIMWKIAALSKENKLSQLTLIYQDKLFKLQSKCKQRSGV